MQMYCLDCFTTLHWTSREETRWRTRFRIAAQNINNCPRINPQKRTLPHQTHGKGW